MATEVSVTPTPSPTAPVSSPAPVPTSPPTSWCTSAKANVVKDSANEVNSADIQFILDNWMSANVAADISEDGMVNSFDFECVHRWFGK